MFADGQAEPSLETARAAVAHAQSCQPEVIIGLGGGSNMDLAKMTAVLYTYGGDLYDYFGFDRIPGPVLPLVCIPTTAGTGSEVSHAAVLTDAEAQVKVSTMSNYLRPDLAVVDPLLTIACPRRVTAASGIDALVHAIEAYTATDYDQMQVPPGEKSSYDGRHPLGACLAEKAIQLIGQYLVRAVCQGKDPEAREAMSLAATLAGLAFSNCGVALVHALEYPLGGLLHCSHGEGNGLLLPHVMRFNLPARPAEMARIAQLLGCDTSGLSDHQAAEQAIAAVQRLQAAIGLPSRIADLGGRADQLAQFAEKAYAIRRLMWVNPRPVTLEDIKQILKEAF